MAMATSYNNAYGLSGSSSSQRGVAMVLALVSAVVLSPLYVDRRNDQKRHYYYETKWSSGFVLPMFLAGLIVAIKTTSSTASNYHNSPEAASSSSLMPKIGSSPWGLAGILVLLMVIMSWQSSMQQFLWR